MTNPLLEATDLPRFSAIRPEHVEPAIDTLLADNRARLDALLAQDQPFTWDSLVRPLEAMDDRLSQAWSPVSHLNAVANSDELRAAYNACLPKLTEYTTEMGQNEALFQAFQAVADRDDFAALPADRRRAVEHALRDFRLAGVDLPEEKKARYREIANRLSELGSKFQENVLDATNAWHKHLDDAGRLQGLPESNLAMLQQAAEQAGESGYRIGLDFPSVFAVLTHCRDRDLRQEVYEAFGTRASDQGPHAGQWDNTALMDEILALRHEKARLLGYDNYAELSLATKMADRPQAVMDFLTDLARRAKPVAEREFEELRAFAREELGLDDLQPWDVTFASEQLRQNRYAISQEDLRPYFPAQRVIDGLFQVVERLYGVEIRENTKAVETWHQDVQFFEIRDPDGTLRGRFFTDLYARNDKRSGAWMAECKVRRDTGDGVQTPVAFLTCNFAPPVGDQPALLTHTEVETLFHEFGHGLHGLLARSTYRTLSGTSVPRDFVEVPSQIMENWILEPEMLRLYARHYETDEVIPDEVITRLREAQKFNQGFATVEYLAASFLDMDWHTLTEPVEHDTIEFEKVSMKRIGLIPEIVPRYMSHYFNHIAGGYSAGYYSYIWSEVLDADAFQVFKENGLFDRETGMAFRRHILERGGTEDPMVMFVRFRGAEPNVEPLLVRRGLK